jgi:hypothetical protein
MIDCLYDALNKITWPDLKDDTVLKISVSKTVNSVKVNVVAIGQG